MSWFAVVAVVALAGCNPAFGLTQATAIPEDAPIDRDHDGILDPVDNCPDLANPDQLNFDSDPRGDACDLCPAIADAVDHDEDRDDFGDSCDPCPAFRDYGQDSDEDDIGDVCDINVTNRRVYFEPFFELKPPFVASGVAWQVSGDEVVPVGDLPSNDHGLEARTLLVSGANGVIDLGVETSVPWTTGHQYGIAIYDGATNTLLADCRVDCQPAGCVSTLSVMNGGGTNSVVEVFVPLDRLALAWRYNALALNTFAYCGGIGLPIDVDPANVWLALRGSPAVRLRYVEVFE